MRYPSFLPDKGTIGFAAPSFGAAIEPYRSAFDAGKEKLRRLGFSIKDGPNVYASDGIGISNTPKKCGEELNELMTAPDVDALISVGGGELMCEVVPYMDFEKIRTSDPKWFMGYSDNTNYTFLSATLADTAAIYGPNAPAFGMEPWHPAIQDALDLLQGKMMKVHSYKTWELESTKTAEHPFEPYHAIMPTHFHYYEAGDLVGSRKRSVQFSGRLLGGCVDSLVNLLGTRFDKVRDFNTSYAQDGILWFLECCDLTVISIRRAFWQMKEAGWFETAKGFLIGRPWHYNEPEFGLDQYQAVTGVLADLHAPVLMDVDIGHHPPMMPMITGAMAEVEAEDDDLEIRYSFS